MLIRNLALALRGGMKPLKAFEQRSIAIGSLVKSVSLETL